MDTTPIKHQRVTAMASQYEQAIKEINEASAILIRASERLTLEFGTSCGIRHGIAGNGLERSIREIKQDAWRYILKQAQVTSFLSMKRQKELDKQIEENKLPEITEENIMSTLQSFMSDSSSLLNETVKEVFDWLLPHWRDEFKTNKKYKIGPKVIKTWMVDPSWGNCFHVRYGSEKELTALDNAFNLLDGKGVRRHPENLVCAINTAMKDQELYEDELYKIKWYLKGTMHIEFKRLDLLKKLNEAGAGQSNQVGDREYTHKKYDLVPV